MSIALEKRVKLLEQQLAHMMLRLSELEEQDHKPKRGRPVKSCTGIGLVKQAEGVSR